MVKAVSIRREAQPWAPVLTKDILKPEPSFHNKNGHNTERIQVRDIRRQATTQRLVPCIVEGLKSKDRECPPLLLWNDRGLSLFDAILNSPDYYLAAREWSILRESVEEIVHSIPSGGRLIELGAGNMKKTALILQTLQAQHKRILYIACDVDRTALIRCLRELQAMFLPAVSSISIQGMVGTYEDCAAWLKHNNNNSHGNSPRTSLMWLGNSMANFTPHEASDHIRSFLGCGASMIIALDGCQDWAQIVRSYEGEPNRAFVLNGLLHANKVLRTTAFKVNDWEIVGRWNEEVWMHECFYAARRDLELTVCGERYLFRRGDTMRSIRSGKWPKEMVMEICRHAGGAVVESWLNQEKSYGVYLVNRT